VSTARELYLQILLLNRTCIEMAPAAHSHSKGAAMKENPYRDLGIMAALSFLAMYVFMYAMVDGLDDVYMNINQVYMAGVMSAPLRSNPDVPGSIAGPR
jgi:hypothetical protein